MRSKVPSITNAMRANTLVHNEPVVRTAPMIACVLLDVRDPSNHQQHVSTRRLTQRHDRHEYVELKSCRDTHRHNWA